MCTSTFMHFLVEALPKVRNKIRKQFSYKVLYNYIPKYFLERFIRHICFTMYCNMAKVTPKNTDHRPRHHLTTNTPQSGRHRCFELIYWAVSNPINHCNRGVIGDENSFRCIQEQEIGWNNFTICECVGLSRQSPSSILSSPAKNIKCSFYILRSKEKQHRVWVVLFLFVL